MKKHLLIAIFFVLMLSQGCISQYLNEVDENLAKNLNDFNVYVNVGEDSLKIYNSQGNSNEFSYNSCTNGVCTFFLCERNSSIDDKNPYDFLFGQNLVSGHCLTPSLTISDKEVEENFAIALYKNQQIENVKYGIEIVGVSQGATPFEFNEANPSCNNHISYPVFTIKGTEEEGYIFSPILLKQTKRYIEKNKVPVFILNAGGKAPKPEKDNSGDIADIISVIDSTSIIFTEANPENTDENIDRIVDQLNNIIRSCKADDLSGKYEFKIKCMPGLSVPFTGNPKDSYDFYKKVETKYAQKYGLSKNNPIYQSNPGEGLNEVSLIVGFPLISSKLPSKSCNGYELINIGMKTAKKFAFNNINLLNIGTVKAPRFTFIQGIYFDEINEINKCNISEMSKVQAYYSMFTSAGGFSRYGIINIPSPDFYDSTFNGDPIAKTENGKIQPNQQEYSQFFSYCQQYYERNNYRALSFRNSATTQICPFQILMPSTDYLSEKTGTDNTNEPLFDVDPQAFSSIKNKQIYRCEACLSYSKPEIFLNNINTNSVPSGTCSDKFADAINLQSSKFGVDPDFLKAISLVETGNMQKRECAISFVSQSSTKCNIQNIGINELKTALQEVECPIPEERYLVSSQNGIDECVLRSDPRVTSSSPKCKPCAYGFMQTISYPGYIYQEKGLKLDEDVKVCGEYTYNPFNITNNACSASAKMARNIYTSFELIGRYGSQIGIDINDADDIGKNSAFLSAIMYERGSVSQILFSDFANIKQLKEKGTDEACENAPEPARSYCCEKKEGEWKFDGKDSCCKDDFFDYINSCNINSLEYARKTMRYYKGTLTECKMCYNEEWEKNACDYAKEVAQADICKGEIAKKVNPFSNIYSSEQFWQNYIKTVEEGRNKDINS